MSEGSQQLLSDVQLYNAHLNIHPYFDLLGFDARSDLSTQAVGRLIYHLGWNNFYNLSTKENYYGNNGKKISQLKSEYFKKDEKELLREILEENDEQLFYQKMLEKKSQLQNLYSKQDILNIRFQRFLLKHSFNKPLLLSINGEYPNYALMRMIHLLYLSNLLFNNDQNGIALYIEQLIRRSENVEDILEKMVLISMLSQSIMILNQLDKREYSSNIRLSKLLPEQISLRSSLAIEFASSSVYWDRINSSVDGVDLFDQIDKNNDIVEVKPLKKYFLKGIGKFLFLKNMTKNQQAQYYKSIIEITELRHQEYKKALSEKAFVEEFKLKSIQNVVGQKLAFLASPSWLHYSVRMHLINQKIQIFNVLSSNRQFDLNQLNQNQDGYEYYRTETELCIKSPDPHQDQEQWKQYKSCLRI